MKAKFILSILIFIMIFSLPTVKGAAGTHPGISSLCASGSLSIASTNLLRAYDLETIVSSNAKDFSSSNNAVPGGGITIGGVSEKFGKSTNFDGIDDKLTGTAPTTPTSFTVAMYLYPRTSGSKIAFSASVANNMYISYGIISANKFTVANNAELITTTGTFAAAAWHSVIVTHTGTSMVLRVDGVEKSQASTGIVAWTNLNIGNFNNNNWFDGYIDELTIWGRVLSSDELLTYESGPSGTCVQPVCQLGSVGTTLETLVPILVSAGLIVFGLGFFFIANESKGKGGKGFPLELLIVGVIGIVIAVAVAAGTVASMKVC